MRVFRDLFWFFRQEKKSYLWGISILVFLDLAFMIPPFAAQEVIDAIVKGKMENSLLIQWSIVILIIAVVGYAFSYVWRILLFGAANKLGMVVRKQLYDHYLRMSPRFFMEHRTGDLMAHATNDVQAVMLTAREGILMLVDSLVMGCLVVGIMFYIDWQIALVAIIPFPILAYLSNLYGAWIHERYDKAQAAFSHMSEKVQENITGMRVIKAFGQEKAESKEFKQILADVVEKNRRVTKVDALYEPTIIMLVGLSFLLSVGFGSWKVWHGELTLGQLTQFNLYLGMLIWPMFAFGYLFNILEKGKASYDRITKLLAIQPEIQDDSTELETKPKGELRFEIKSFRYPDKEIATLEDIRFCLRPGQTLGIVGKTGSGKTTILRLLMREFQDPKASVFWGDHDISHFPLQKLRSELGYVPQDHVLFSATIRENIAFGKPGATNEEVEEYAKLAHIHEDILHFADGYETEVGERGVTLSGGQKQRISIARALLLHPEVLLLDDSLSAVDAQTEHDILEQLRTKREGRTTIITAHRLSAVEHADLILVLEDGKCIERGTHQELWGLNGWYRQTYEQQQLEKLVESGGIA
ncbi:ABC transporter ATP-binding protein [Risungbinella massiliensis]|uniref:ABC transporter ATP-binding protein n=1 Tax=Risungbinella massiliensis TaxID=1329796 RepID=UPI0005CC0705|nr:ABC transporter transmembrane domain-containing protein [Risungbinella massiliensis]